MYSAGVIAAMFVATFPSAASWRHLLTDAPVHLIALAGTVYAVVQAIKKVNPTICGKYAVGLNVTLSIAGVLVGLRPENLWSQATLVQIVMVAAAAAGVHGTTKSLGGAPSAPSPSAGLISFPAQTGPRSQS